MTPELTTTFRSSTTLLNALAYNPPGQEEGYLFWAAWLNHDGASIFVDQDAHGPIRRGLVAGLVLALRVAAARSSGANAVLGTLSELLEPARRRPRSARRLNQAGRPREPAATTPRCHRPRAPPGGGAR